MPMRRLCLILLCGLVAAPAALAAARASGDGVLELRQVYGQVAISPGKGVLWGQMDRGVLKVTDPLPGDGNVYVSGYERSFVSPDTPTVTLYSGTDIHFRITGGRYKLQFYRAAGIDLTAVGVGTATVIPDVSALDAGDYALDGGKWKPVPPLGTLSVPFGAQSVSVP